MSQTNIVTFADHPVVTAKQVHEGFSDRLHTLIDMTDMGAPDRSRGRPTWLAGLLDCNKTSTRRWLKDDETPNDANSDPSNTSPNLYKIVQLLLAGTPNHQDTNPIRVISWLRYGDQVGNPFSGGASASQGGSNQNLDYHQDLTVFATHMVITISGESSLAFNRKLISMVVELLETRKVREIDELTDADRLVVKSYIDLLKD